MQYVVVRTRLLFIHLIYLYFFPGGRDIGFYPSVLIAGYYRALRASFEPARGEPKPRESRSLVLRSLFVACIFMKSYNKNRQELSQE